MGWPVLTDDNMLHHDARVKAPFRLTDTFESTAICSQFVCVPKLRFAPPFESFLFGRAGRCIPATTILNLDLLYLCWTRENQAKCPSSIKANTPKCSVSVASSYRSQSKITTGPPRKKVLLADSGKLSERQGHYIRKSGSTPSQHPTCCRIQ